MRSSSSRAALLLALLAPRAFAQAPASAPLPVTLEEVEAYEAAATRFRDRMAEFAVDARAIVDQLEQEERGKVAFSYDALVEDLNNQDKELRAETLARFEAFLAKYPDTEYSPHVMFRLAELYFELANEEFAVENDAYDRMFEGMTDEQLFALDEIPERPRLDQSRSVALYKRILAEHPDYEFIPGTLYMLGFSYGNTNSKEYDEPNSTELFVGYFTRLVTEHPDSPIAVAGNWGLGIYYFDEREVERAIPYFKAARDKLGADTSQYQNTTYMLAWSHYLLSEYQPALTLFTELLDISDRVFAETGRPVEARKEAIEYSAYSIADVADRSLNVFSDPGWMLRADEDDRALAALLTDLGLGARPVSPVELHEAWFNRVGERAYEPDIMKKLAELLEGYARYDEAIAVYEHIQRTWTDDPLNPRYQREIARIQNTYLGDVDAAASSMAQIAERYGEDSSWALANRNNPDALNEARGYIEASLYEVAKQLHVRAAETGDGALYSQAADRYAEYIEQFPFADDYFEASWYLADALFNSGRHREAIAQHERLLKVGGHDYIDAAIWFRFKSWYEILTLEHGGPEAVPPGAVVERTVATAGGTERQVLLLSDDHKAFIAAADAVRGHAFKEPEFAETRQNNLSALYYIPGQILYHHNRYEEARPRLEQLIAELPRTDDASRAAALIVTSYVNEGDLERVVEVSNKYRLMNLGADQGMKANNDAAFKSLEEGGKFKLALKRKESGDLIGAAEDFLAFMQEFPDSTNVSLALYNAANTYEGAGKVERANELYEQYIIDYPRGEFAQDLFWRIATNYGAILEMDKAIAYYERLASLYPTNQNAAAAIYNAGLLKVGKGDNRGAATNFEFYVKKWPTQPDAEQVFWLAGEQWKLVSDQEALAYYTRYLRQFPDQNPDHVIEAHHWMAKYYERTGKKRQAEDAWAQVLASYNRFAGAGRPVGAKGRNLAAEASFRDLQALYDRYVVVEYPKDEEQLPKYLGLDPSYEGGKAVELIELEQRSLALVQTFQDFEYSSAAIFLWGSAYLAYSDMLFNAPCPPKFTEEMCLILQDAVAAEAVKPQEKGVNRLLQNLEKAQQEKRNSVWIDRTIARLNEFDPATYPLEKPESRGYAAAQVVPSAGPMDMPEPSPAKEP